MSGNNIESARRNDDYLKAGQRHSELLHVMKLSGVCDVGESG